MSLFSSPSPLTIPFKFRRKSSSASTSASMDHHTHVLSDTTSPSSPLLSSSPLLTPLHLTRPYEWRVGEYSDDIAGLIHDPRHKFEDVHDHSSRHTRSDHPLPYTHCPLPSLMTKFAPHALRSGTPLSYSSSPFSCASQTASLYPQGDSAIADDYEEYDLESMDIHIRETYFATSAERGRWLSSPIPSRMRSQAVAPTRSYSSPVKDTSPPRHYSQSRSADKQNSPLPEEECGQDMPCSSPLPPSSPLASPLSTVSFLADEHDDSAVDSLSNPDNCHSLAGTPELSISSTTCTSPVEPVCTPNSQAPTILSVLRADSSDHSSAISPPTCPTRSLLPEPFDAPIRDPSAATLELNESLSPLPQFELDVSDVEPAKLPLSDRKNQAYPGQTIGSGVLAGAARCQDGPASVQYPSMNHIPTTLDDSPGTVCGSTSASGKKTKERSGRPAAKRRRRVVVRTGSPSSDARKRGGVESQASSHSEPPNKKKKLSHRRADSERQRASSLPRRSPKVKRCSRSPSLGSSRDTKSTSPHDKTSNPTDRAQLQRRTPVPVDVVKDAEFHASLTGMLIEALATSRATSMDSSRLYLVLTQAHPDLATKLSKGDLVMEIADVLEAGRARCGMFEKVDSSGERSRHKASESRWFYIPERDEDPDRASLISAIMPRQKRNETKKYKQYYYQPLDKISRWDPEDAL